MESWGNANAAAPAPPAGGWQVPLTRAIVGEDDLEAVVEAYRSGWLSMGPRTADLERTAAEQLGVEHAVAVSSCSAALHIACLGLGLGPGDSVVAPSLTFVATVSAAIHAGAEPRLTEIRSLTEPWLSAQAAEEAIDETTRAIVTTTYGGHPGEVEALRAVANRHGLALIEDAAHGCGTWVGTRHAGTIGDVGALSFSATKNAGIGEGGMLLTADDVLAERARRLRWHGITASSWERHRGAPSSYSVAEPGFNYRIDDPRAALARRRLERVEEENARRETIDAAYRAALGELEGVEPTAPPPPGTRSSHCLFTVVLDPALDRDQVRRSLAARGVQTSVHFPPVHRFPPYERAGGELPLTDAYALRSLTLPMFAEMEPWQRDLVIEAVTESVREAERAAA